MAICTTDNRVEDDWMDIGKSVYSPNGTKSYLEPIQGCVNDCFFMAALISVAWAKNAILNIHPNYRFFNGASWDPLFTINKDLAVDNTDNLVYARTSSQYIWPCLYEKAYAKWMDKPANRDEPPIGEVLKGGNGLYALQNICGGTRYTNPATIPILSYAGNRTQYPTIVQMNGHNYSVLRKSADGWELKNPCGGGLIYVDKIDNTLFSEWGYVK